MRRGTWTILALGLSIFGCSPAFLANPGIDPELYPEPSRNAITFWGHATSYIDVGGVGIVTDPVFEDGYSPWHGRKIPSPPTSAYDQTDIILISHAHRDHLQPKSIARFSEGTVILCPEPSAKYVDDLDLEVRVMKPGDEYEFAGGRIVAVPAHHPGGRNSFRANHDGDALGYVIHTSSQTIYYSGDTAYFPGLHDIGRAHQPDVVILNINVHLNSYEAILAIGALGVPTVIPTHFGAYAGSNARRSPAWRDELQRLMGETIVSLEVGESYHWQGTDLAQDRKVPAKDSLEDD